MNKRQLLRTFIINQTFHWFIVGIMLPVITLLQLEKGFNLFQISITMSIFSATVVLLELPTGGLSDTIGRKKVYLVSLVFNFLAASLILLARNFLFITLGFFFLGVGRALSSGSLDAWFVDEFYLIDPEGNLQKALSKVGIFIPIGIATGSLLGGFIPMNLGKIMHQLWGLGLYSSNLITVLCLSFIQYILTSKLIVEEVKPVSHSSLTSGFKLLPKVLSSSIEYGVKNNIILILLLTTFAWGVGFSGLETFWQPQVKDILGSDSQTWIFGVLAAGYFLAGSLGNLLITPLCNLFKNNYLMVLFFIRFTMGILFFILALQKGMILFAVFYLTLFLFNGMNNAPHAAVLNRYIPTEKRSTLLSFESLFLQVGCLIGRLAMGYIANSNSITMAWLMGATFVLFSCFFYLILHFKKA